jgi:sorbitol-specific phosphotransferase system component IIC
MNKTAIHAAAGTLAMLLIATFWTSTLVSELFLDTAAVVAVKHAIAMYGLLCLVVFMAMTGGSGFALGKVRKARLIEEKKKRMLLIGANGLLIMIPSAIFLNIKAADGAFDRWFYAVQVLELAVGVVQLTLMGKNFRAGLRLSGRLRATRTP